MVVLALDSTTRAGSVALWRDGLVEVRPGDATRTHAERLPAELADLLAAHDLTVAGVDLFAVASGPGSFTGMRVGIATMQALALVHGRGIVARSTLDLLALAAADSLDAATGTATGIVVSWMEAYRGEVFAAACRVTRGTGVLDPIEMAAVGRPAELAGAWASRLASEAASSEPRAALVVIGDAVPSTADILRDAFGASATLLDAPPLAGVLACTAAAAPGEAVRPHAVVPVYVRRPDAELGRERQQHAEATSAPDASPVR